MDNFQRIVGQSFHNISTIILCVIYSAFSQMNPFKNFSDDIIKEAKSFKITHGAPVTISINARKGQLFTDLAWITSGDPSLLNHGQIRILEWVTNSGYNFRFYPTNSHVIIVQPVNGQAMKAVKLYQNRNLTVEKVFYTSDCDMGFVGDSSVDAVVATFALSHVKDYMQLINEFHRVLMPNGKYYFMEQHEDPEHREYWKLQIDAMLKVKSLCDSEQADYATDEDEPDSVVFLDQIVKSGLFKTVNVALFALPKSVAPIRRARIGTLVSGVAIKRDADEPRADTVLNIAPSILLDILDQRRLGLK
ncbi:hypothetical protein CHUAL_008270 [Chamberlinius hualienensis]